MRSTFFPLELRFHSFFQFLLICTKCHNPLENHGRNEHHIFFIFAFPNLFCWHGDGTCCFYIVFYSVLCFSLRWFDQSKFHFHRGRTWRLSVLKQEKLHVPWTTKDVWNMLTIWSAVSLNFTPPHTPFCKQQRNLQRSNIFQPSNIFQDSTSSNALHMTLLHPTPPHPPICIQERPFWYCIKTEGSSKLRGTPSLEPIYIYTCTYIYI